LCGSTLATAAADGGDKEGIRLMIEPGANICAPQRSNKDVKRCSGQGVDFFDHRHSEEVCKMSWSGILYADQGKKTEAERIYIR
jgi:hypothetical protein